MRSHTTVFRTSLHGSRYTRTPIGFTKVHFGSWDNGITGWDYTLTSWDDRHMIWDNGITGWVYTQTVSDYSRVSWDNGITGWDNGITDELGLG